MDKIVNVDEILEQLSIESFLRDHGHIPNSKGFYHCFYPEHDGEDTNASAQILPGGTRLWCHGCKQGRSIMGLLNLLERLPIDGAAFFDALEYLAKKQNISIKYEKGPTDTNAQIHNIWETAFNLIQGVYTPKAEEVMKARGWSQKTAEYLELGCIVDWEHFQRAMNSRGISNKSMVELARLSNTDSSYTNWNPFGPDYLYFPIRDHRGRACALGCMNLYHNKGSQGAKYYNTSSSDIFDKKRVLFGFDKVRRQPTGPVYITEGYADCASMIEHGLKNVVAVCTSNLSDGHASLLRNYSRRDILLLFDGDTAGWAGTMRAIEHFGFGSGLRIRVINLPDGMDADDVLRRSGVEGITSIEPMEPVPWLCWHLREHEGKDAYDIAKRVSEIIAKEPDPLDRDRACAYLAQHTDIRMSIIQEGVMYHRDATKQQLSRKIRQETQDLITVLSRDPTSDEAMDMLTSVESKVRMIRSTADDNATPVERDILDKQISEEESKTSGLDGLRTGINWMDNMFRGFPTHGNKHAPIMIGGREHSGKSALINNLCRGLLLNNPKAKAVFQTIDDSQETLYEKWRAMAAQLPIDAISHPNMWRNVRRLRNWGLVSFDELMDRRDRANKELRELLDSGRLIVRDQRSMPTVSYAHGLLEDMRVRYPDDPIYYFIDAFNDLSDALGEEANRRTDAESASSKIKSIAQRLNIVPVFTCHYTKTSIPGIRPNNGNIKETGMLAYHANIIIHVFNILSEINDHRGLSWQRRIAQSIDELNVTTASYSMDDPEDIAMNDFHGEILPVVELNIAKNKKSGRKGYRYLKFDTDMSLMIEPSNDESYRYRNISSQVGKYQRMETRI